MNTAEKAKKANNGYSKYDYYNRCYNIINRSKRPLIANTRVFLFSAAYRKASLFFELDKPFDSTA